MADSTLTALPAAAALDGTELLYGVQSGASVKILVSAIKTLVLAGITLGAGATITLGGASAISVAAGKTLTVSNILNLTGNDGTTINFGAGGTLAYTSNNLSVFAVGGAIAPTSGAFGGGVIGTDSLEVTGTTTFNGAVLFASAPITLTGNLSAPFWGTNGIRIRGVAGFMNDTTTNSTVVAAYTDVLGGNTITANTPATYTNYFGMYLRNSIAGANVTITNNWALGADSLKVGTSGVFQVSAAGILTTTGAVLTTPVLGITAATSLALGGATIGTDNLAVTGTTTFNGQVNFVSVPLVISGNLSKPAWTTTGLRLRAVPGVLTDTTSSGTVATAYTDVFGGNTIAASSATTFTNYFSTYINAPVAGTNVTLTNGGWAFGADSMKIGTSNKFTVNTTGDVTVNGTLTLASAPLTISGNISAPSWGGATIAAMTGLRIKGITGIMTDTSTAVSTTVVNGATDLLGGNTIAATNTGVVYTNYYSAYFKNPVAGTNITLTNPFALGADSLKIGSASVDAAFTGGTSPFVVNYSGTTNDAWFINTGGTLNGLSAGVLEFQFTLAAATPSIRIGSAGVIKWNSTASLFAGVIDTGIARNAAGVLEVNNGTPGTLRDLTARFVSTQGESRVSAQFDKTSDAALANVPGLSVTVTAGKTYSFRAVLFTTSNVAGGVQAAIAGTATATAIIYEGENTNAAVLGTQTRVTALGSAVGAATAVTAATIIIEGTITVNAGGTLTVQFAQNVSNAAASSVLVGSTFNVWQF